MELLNISIWCIYEIIVTISTQSFRLIKNTFSQNEMNCPYVTLNVLRVLTQQVVHMMKF